MNWERVGRVALIVGIIAGFVTIAAGVTTVAWRALCAGDFFINDPALGHAMVPRTQVLNLVLYKLCVLGATAVSYVCIALIMYTMWVRGPTTPRQHGMRVVWTSVLFPATVTLCWVLDNGAAEIGWMPGQVVAYVGMTLVSVCWWRYLVAVLPEPPPKDD